VRSGTCGRSRRCSRASRARARSMRAAATRDLRARGMTDVAGVPEQLNFRDATYFSAPRRARRPGSACAEKNQIHRITSLPPRPPRASQPPSAVARGAMHARAQTSPTVALSTISPRSFSGSSIMMRCVLHTGPHTTASAW
jgi:hypothetical protein